MSRTLKPHELPAWPRRMGVGLAAAYCGESISAFYAKFSELATGPKGNQRWFIEDLDRALDAIKDGRKADSGDPYLEGLRDAS